jgi:hypothetical protein
MYCSFFNMHKLLARLLLQRNLLLVLLLLPPTLLLLMLMLYMPLLHANYFWHYLL